MTHKQATYDPETKTLHVETSSDRTDPNHVTKIWDADPQLQTINLLKDIKNLLQHLVDRDPPYHSGPQAVVIEP